LIMTAVVENYFKTALKVPPLERAETH